MKLTKLALASVALTFAWLPAQAEPRAGFFITSVSMGDGANLGGLEGADAHCGKLAYEAGLPSRD